MKQLTFYTAKVQELYEYLEASIFEEICKALKKQLAKNPDEITLAYWQVEALAETGQLTEEILKRIAEVAGLTEETVRYAVYSAGYDTARNVDSILSKNREVPPFNPMITALESLVNQATMNLDNLVNQTLIANNTANLIYQDIISKATAEVAVGYTTLDKAVAKAVNEWVDKGVPSGFMDKGGRVWNIQNYARTVINTTANNAYNQATYDRMSDYGIYTVLVGSHPEAREACSLIQGHVVDLRPMGALPPNSEYKSVYDPYWKADYLQPHGHRGVNCHHPHLPFDPEFAINDMPKYDPQEAVRKSEIEQGRKNIANRIRKSKTKLMAYEALGDEARANYYKKLLNKQRKDMVQYVKANDLRREYSLEKVVIPSSKVISDVKRDLKT